MCAINTFSEGREGSVNKNNLTNLTKPAIVFEQLKRKSWTHSQASEMKFLMKSKVFGKETVTKVPTHNPHDQLDIVKL